MFQWRKSRPSPDWIPRRIDPGSEPVLSAWLIVELLELVVLLFLG